MPMDFSNPDRKIIRLRPSHYRLQHTMETLMKESPRELSEMLRNHKFHVHLGVLVSLDYAVRYCEDVKAELGDDLLSCFVHGGVARGLKSDRLPKDIDIVLITKRGKTRIGAKHHPRISPEIFDEDYLNVEKLVGDNEQSSYFRRVIALPILILHGHDHMYHLRDIARTMLRFDDICGYIDHQVKKRQKELAREGREMPPSDIIQLDVINELGVVQELRDLLYRARL